MARPIFGTNSRVSNARPSGVPQGSPGGRPKGGALGMKKLPVGDEFYLWILVFIEVALMGLLRNHFRRYHGG